MIIVIIGNVKSFKAGMTIIPSDSSDNSKGGNWGDESQMDYAIRVMEQLENEADNLDTQVKQYLGDNKSFYSFADPSDNFKSKVVASKNTVKSPEEGYVYYFTEDYSTGNKNREPVSPYSTIQKALSLAHIVTMYQDPSLFIRYAVGSWKHLNEIQLHAYYDVCEGDGSYEYHCKR